MTFRHDPDDVIAAWAADSTGGGGPDYLPEVLLMVERTPQRRWARWFPGPAGAPAKAPSMSSRTILAVAAMLLLLLVASALVAGSLRRPAFVLQGVVPVPGSVGIPFVSASGDAIWSTVEDGVVAIDPRTGATTRFEIPGAGTGLTGVVATADAIWAADYDGNRVVRLDRATGKVTTEVPVLHPWMLQLQDGAWVLEQGTGVVHLDQQTGVKDIELPAAVSFAVSSSALWYVATTGGEASAVEVDPATGIERRRIAIPFEAAADITIDASGNPWIYRGRRGIDRSTVARIDASTGVVGVPFDVPYDVIGGIHPIGSSMWGLTAPGSPDGSQLVELGATGPTGRVEKLDDNLDPDYPVVAFGSIWIPWDSHAKLYQYPVDALAP
jgi:hypothetical protein